MFDPLRSRNHVDFVRIGNKSALVSDPLADLLLSVAAIIIIALIAILPHIPRHPVAGNGSASALQGLPTNSKFRLEGRVVAPLVAAQGGLVMGRAPSVTIPVDRILVDESLITRLKRMRDTDEALVLFIEPNGLEAAFQFEVAANRYGPKRIVQVRLASDCSHVKSERLARYCRILNR